MFFSELVMPPWVKQSAGFAKLREKDSSLEGRLVRLLFMSRDSWSTHWNKWLDSAPVISLPVRTGMAAVQQNRLLNNHAWFYWWRDAWCLWFPVPTMSLLLPTYKVTEKEKSYSHAARYFLFKFYGNTWLFQNKLFVHTQVMWPNIECSA